MARRIDHRTRSRWNAKTVYTTLVDAAYLNARLAVLGGRTAQLVEHDVRPDGATIKLRHGVAAENLPPAVRMLLGGDLMIDRTETWRVDPAGGYTGNVSVTIPAMPGELGGTQRLADTGSEGSELVLNGSVSIPIPLVGGRIEETVAGQIASLLDSEHDFTEGWLEQHQT
jgi:hypothetical protein